MKAKIIFSLPIFVLFLSFTLYDQTNDWVVPAKYEEMENPQDADQASLKTGKSLYNKHCGSCHGKEGLGDGTKAAQLDTPCGDFSTAEFHSQSDGAIFYKSIEGRDDMPNFRKKIPYEEDVWHIVNYIKTFEE